MIPKKHVISFCWAGTQPKGSTFLKPEKKNELQELLDRVKVDLKDILFSVFWFEHGWFLRLISWGCFCGDLFLDYFWIYIYIIHICLGFVCSFMRNQQKHPTTTVVSWGPPEYWELEKRHGKIISENPDKMTEPITFLLGWSLKRGAKC